MVGPDQYERGESAEYLDPLNNPVTLRSLAEKCNVPFVDLSQVTTDASLLEQFPVELLHSERLLPLALQGGRLRVAVGDPFKLESISRHSCFEGYELDTEISSRIGGHIHITQACGGKIKLFVYANTRYTSTSCSYRRTIYGCCS